MRVDQHAPAHFAGQNFVELLAQVVEADYLDALCFKPSGFQVGGDSRPHCFARLNRCLHTVDAEQVDAAQNKWQHSGG